MATGLKRMSQSIGWLSCKYEDLNSSPHIHVKIPGMMAHSCSLNSERQEQEGLLSSCQPYCGHASHIVVMLALWWSCQPYCDHASLFVVMLALLVRPKPLQQPVSKQVDNICKDKVILHLPHTCTYAHNEHAHMYIKNTITMIFCYVYYI